MNKILLSKALLFISGAALGSVITWKLVKTKYEKIAQEEIDSVREVYAQRKPEDDSSPVEEEEREESDQDLVEECKQWCKDLGYTSDDVEDDEHIVEDDAEDDENYGKNDPYVISPEELGDCDYPVVTLRYFEDGVLTNNRGKIISNVDELIGEDSLTHFGEYEEDSVFVRNDEQGVDYEILMDYRAYAEKNE